MLHMLSHYYPAILQEAPLAGRLVLQERVDGMAECSMPESPRLNMCTPERAVAEKLLSHLPHGEEPLGIQELQLVLDQLLEVADDEAALLLHPAIECHRLCICPQSGMQLPIGPCACKESLDTSRGPSQ